MASHVVQAFGRRIVSPFLLPGLVGQEHLANLNLSSAIEISFGPVVLHSPMRSVGSYAIGSGGLRIFASRGLAFLCDPFGRTIRVEADPDLSEELIAAHLVANGIPAALWMQGERLLHAGAVRLPGPSGTVLIAGDSGSGKSTILAELVAAGGQLAAEDFCTLRVHKNHVVAAGFSAQLQLGSGYGAEPKKNSPVPMAQQLQTLETNALVVLDSESNPDQVAPIPMLGVQKLHVLLRHRYRPVIATLLDRNAEDLRAWAECATALSVYSWNPWAVERRDWLSVLRRLGSHAEPGG